MNRLFQMIALLFRFATRLRPDHQAQTRTRHVVSLRNWFQRPRSTQIRDWFQRWGPPRTSHVAHRTSHLICLLLLLPAAVALGQTKVGTTVGQFLLIEPGARTAGMGNAGVATFDDLMAAYYNPGAAGYRTGSGVQFTHSRWLAEIEYNYGIAAVGFGTGNTFLLTVTTLNSGEIDVRTVDQPLGTGERYTVSNLALGLGFSRRVTDRFSAGIQVKLIQETIWHSRLSATALDLGVLYELPFRAHIGASISNFGTRGTFDGRDLRIRFDQDPGRFGDNSSLPAALETEDFPLPIFFRVGIGFPVDLGANNQLKLAVDAFHPSDNTESVSLGGEWGFRDLFFARAGYQNLFQDDSEMGLTLGGGLKYRTAGQHVRFDYAWVEHERIGNTHRFTLGLDF